MTNGAARRSSTSVRGSAAGPSGRPGGIAVRVGVREVGHELQRGEHRLVVLVLVLDDHAVDEPVGEQRVGAPVEASAGCRAPRARASRTAGDEPARAGGSRMSSVLALAARVLERVVDVVVARRRWARAPASARTSHSSS